MKKTIYLIILFLAFNQAFAQEQKLSALLKDYGIPGMQLVYAKGDKMQSVNIGTVSKGSDKTVTSNTIFEAASLSKCVFSYAVLRLCDRGVMNLDTPLLRYMGSYARFDANDPRYAKITARMVLRHTTGLPNWGNKKGARLIFMPDSTFSYSGEGFVYLQRVVEKLTGKTLNDLAQQEVFTPLNMTSSSYTWTEKFDTLAAFGNSSEAVSMHTNQNAAASLLTNAHDYTLFLQALITGKGLKPATHKMMFDKQSAGNWFRRPVKEANQHIDWGLGVGLQHNEKGKWIWHWGDNGDFKAFYIANPEKKEILVYFTYSNWGLHITTDVLNTFFSKQTWWPCMWTGYQFHELKRMEAFMATLKKQGYEHATEIAEEMKQKDAGFNLPEDDVNDLGFILMRDNKKKEAVEIFKFNLSRFPNSANAYDSLAEGYQAAGEKGLALKNFKKAVELNPKNTYAADRIKELQKSTQ